MSTFKEIKVLVGMPVLGDIKAETTASLVGYYRSCKYPSNIHLSRNTYTHYARNKLVWEAVNTKATHLMFIDSDMSFPIDGVDRLIERGENIIGGLYFKRVVPIHPIIKIVRDNKITDMKFKEIPSFEKPFEVDAIGTGFLLINMDVFKKMEPPFFSHASPKEFGMEEIPFPNNEIGEDVAFCLRAKKAGFKIWCDPTIKLGHIGERIYSIDDQIKK